MLIKIVFTMLLTLTEVPNLGMAGSSMSLSMMIGMMQIVFLRTSAKQTLEGNQGTLWAFGYAPNAQHPKHIEIQHQ